MKLRTQFFHLFVLAVLFVLSPIPLSAQSGKSGRDAAVNLDLLIKQTEDLVREGTRILDDQEEILKTIQNLKIWARRQ